jgi:hypothetical protein
MMMMDAAPDSDQVRGHRQQIGNSAALKPFTLAFYPIRCPQRARANNSEQGD